MAKLVIKKSMRKTIGSEGKPMKEVWYKGKYIDTIGTANELKRIKRMIDQQETIENKMNNQRY